MRQTLLTAVAAAALALSAGTHAALADAGLDTESPPEDDLGILLVDMFAAMADTLAAYQDQTANEAYLGSAASTHRLRSAILHAPDVTLRYGPRPFFGACLFCDD